MPNGKKTGERRYELDWLRVYAILLLITIHAAAIFDPFPPTAVKGQESLAMKVFAMFVHQWRLSVLFLISGAGAYFALGSLSGSRFVAMRFRRIVIPLIVGTLLIVPVHLYYWVSGIYPGRYSSYFDFYTQMLKDAFLHGRIGSKPEYLHWAHLWFLAYLFVISVITVPLLISLRRGANHALTSKLSKLCDRKGSLLLAALPFIACELLLRPRWPGDGGPNLVNDWANFSMYLIYYLYGYLIYSDERLRAAVKSVSTTALWLALITTALFFLLAFTDTTVIKLGWMLFLVVRSLNAWFWIVAILGFGMKYLNYTNRLLPVANESTYPIYIVHLPILSIIAYHVVKWDAPVAVQFMVIILGTLIGSIAIYLLLIRQTRVTRYLFGMKLKPLKATRS